MMSNSTQTTHCSLYPDHPYRCKVILALHQTSNSLSLIGCTLVVFLILLLKKYKLFVQKMILAMVISGFFSSVSYIIGDVTTTNEHTCRLQSFMTHYFDWAVLLWVTMITANMLLVVKNISNSKLMPIYHAIVWIGALFWAIIPFFGNAYGKAGLWCWIKRHMTEYRFGTWYGPELVTLVLLIVVYLYIIYTVRQRTKPQSGESVAVQNVNRRYRDELKPLIWYPVVYLALMIPMLLYRIEDASHPNKPPRYGLIVLAAITGPSLGAVNAIVFTVVNASLQEITCTKIMTQIRLLLRRQKEVRITHDYDLGKNSSHSATSSGYSSSYRNSSAVVENEDKVQTELKDGDKFTSINL